MALEKWMETFSHELELDKPLEPSSPGVYKIPLEEDLVITVSAYGDGFSLYCTLASCPATGREEWFTHVMHANLFGQGTKGAVLGLTPDGNMLTLSQVVTGGPDYREFHDVLEDFINTADFWRVQAKHPTII